MGWERRRVGEGEWREVWGERGGEWGEVWGGREGELRRECVGYPSSWGVGRKGGQVRG